MTVSLPQVLFAAWIVLGAGSAVHATPTVVAGWLSSQECKEATEVPILGDPLCSNIIKCDDQGLQCKLEISALGGWPVYQYCSCGSIGNPANSPVCHAYQRQDAQGGFWFFYCSRGNCNTPLGCQPHLLPNGNSTCTCQ